MTSLLEQGRHGTPITDIEVIDMHAHIGVRYGVPGDTGPAALVAAMHRTGVAKTIISSSAPVSAANAEQDNADVLEGVRAFPDRLLGYYRPWPTTEAVTQDEAARRIEAGFIGVKLHDSTGVPYSHVSYDAYLVVAHEQCRPVLFHSWGQDIQLSAIRTIARRYPDARLLAAHAGGRNEGDYIALAHDCENVYLDLTLSFSPRGLVERFVNALGAHRIVWGSDTALFSQAQQLGKVLGARISEDDKIAILSTNARGILDRVRASPG